VALFDGIIVSYEIIERAAHVEAIVPVAIVNLLITAVHTAAELAVGNIVNPVIRRTELANRHAEGVVSLLAIRSCSFPSLLVGSLRPPLLLHGIRSTSAYCSASRAMIRTIYQPIEMVIVEDDRAHIVLELRELALALVELSMLRQLADSKAGGVRPSDLASDLLLWLVQKRITLSWFEVGVLEATPGHLSR